MKEQRMRVLISVINKMVAILCKHAQCKCASSEKERGVSKKANEQLWQPARLHCLFPLCGPPCTVLLIAACALVLCVHCRPLQCVSWTGARSSSGTMQQSREGAENRWILESVSTYTEIGREEDVVD